MDHNNHQTPDAGVPNAPHEELVQLFERHIIITLNGLCATNPNLPWTAMWPSMVSAFARLCSNATKNPQITNTPAAREHLKRCFEEGLKYVPALHLAGAVPPANDFPGRRH